MQQNFIRNVGETKQPLLRHLLHAGTFEHCANWLVKFIPGCLLFLPHSVIEILTRIELPGIQ
jgi:hypothetical protein